MRRRAVCHLAFRALIGRRCPSEACGERAVGAVSGRVQSPVRNCARCTANEVVGLGNGKTHEAPCLTQCGENTGAPNLLGMSPQRCQSCFLLTPPDQCETRIMSDISMLLHFSRFGVRARMERLRWLKVKVVKVICVDEPQRLLGGWVLQVGSGTTAVHGVVAEQANS